MLQRVFYDGTQVEKNTNKEKSNESSVLSWTELFNTVSCVHISLFETIAMVLYLPSCYPCV